MAAVSDVQPLALLVDARNELGECVLWCERSARVFWTDIEGRRLHSVAADGSAALSWAMPERLACFCFTADAEVLLLGLASRLAFFNLKTGAITPLATVEEALPTTRLNDGRCDRQGRFVFGTLDESAVRQPIGSFYRVNADLSVERLPLPGVAIANSICFSVDGSAMYFCDSLQKIIYCWDGYGSGDITQLRVFVDGRERTGSPDGATVDAEGYVWNAAWGAAVVRRYSPDGVLERELALAGSQPSCVCLGGAALNQLFVTTAWENMTADQRMAEPIAGGLFHGAAGVRGLPEARFTGRTPSILSPIEESHAQS